MIQNATAGVWDGAGLAKLLADKDRSDQLLKQITSFIAAHRLQGVTVDFENVPVAAHKDLEARFDPYVCGLCAAWLDHRPGRAVRR
jgi:hypothetical protein